MGILGFLSASDIKLSDGAIYAIVGFVIVLIVLALLVGIFYLTGLLFGSKLFNEKLQSNKSKPIEIEKPGVAENADAEVVAAITAAITMMYESECSVVPSFVIRHIKRKQQ